MVDWSRDAQRLLARLEQRAGRCELGEAGDGGNVVCLLSRRWEKQRDERMRSLEADNCNVLW